MEKNLKSFTKSPWKTRVPDQESGRKAYPENSELLSRNARGERRVENGVLIERKRRISAPLFGSKSDENSDFEGVK